MGYIDIDELMKKKSQSENLFGVVHNKRACLYVSYASVPKEKKSKDS
ncbi:MAG: hypothetical protein KAR20_03660 [Candidatus Heimdallarchaeota archaeon]|nr:hypothetical protein [Candidatus Heimdallarchaeota archaeon]